MKQLPNIDIVTNSLSTAKKAILLMGPNPNLDVVASTLGLALALQKKDIVTHIACEADMRVEFSRLVGIDAVHKKMGNRNLVVSFPYAEERVEKVSYNISDDGKRFNLVISPKTGALPLQSDEVAFEYTGADADHIFMMGVGSLGELGEFYDKERTVFDMAMTVGVTLFPVPPYAKCHIEGTGTSCLCELIASYCQQLGLELSEDAATNLLYGIDVITDGFRSPATTSDTFETVATLMRSGGKRQPQTGTNTIQPNQLPYMPQSPQMPMQQATQMPLPDAPALAQASNSQFAQLLGATQQAPSNQMPMPMTGEFKG